MDLIFCSSALTVLHLLSEDPSRDLTKPATRAQAAVLLVRLAGGEKKPDTDGWFAGFRDVPDWARTAVNYANRRGWISGVSNVQFDPNGHLNADAWCAMLLRMLGYSDKTGDFEISDAAAFAWRIGLTGRQLTGILSVGDLAEAIYDALDFCYKGTETPVLSRLMDFGVCPASAATALGLLNKDYIARQLADRYLSAAFQLSLYETEEQVHDEVSSADASGFFISADGLAVTNYPSIVPLSGSLPGLRAFVAAVFGGIGSIPGAVVGAFLIGLSETVIKSSNWSVFSDAFTFALLIIILVVKPTGLFGEKSTDKV